MYSRFKYCVLFFVLNAFVATAQNGTQLFSNNFVHEIKITSDYPSLYDSLEAHYSTATFDASYIMCNVEVDGVTVDSVGIKEKGLSSNFIPWLLGEIKKPFKIDFGNYISGQLYDGLNKINLTNEFYDPSIMHNAIAFKILNDAGVAAPRVSFAKVYLNSVYWGLYSVVEQVDKKFLDNHFPDHNGNLYKGYASQSGLNWLGSSIAPYLLQYQQQLKNNGDSSYADIIHLCDIANNSGVNYYDSITTRMDMTGFLKSMAVDYCLKNLDGLVTNGHNFYLYHCTTDNKFYWIPWDENETFSYPDYAVLDTFGNSKPVFYNTMQNPTLRNLYFDFICNLTNNIINPSHLFPFIDFTYNSIRPPLVADTNRFFSIAAFDSVIDQNIWFNPAGTFQEVSMGIKPLIVAAYDSAFSALTAYGYTCVWSSGLSEIKNNSVTVYPNPFADAFTIYNTNQNGNALIFDVTGRVIMKFKTSNTQTKINTQPLPQGFYLLQYSEEENTQNFKLMKF